MSQRLSCKTPRKRVTGKSNSGFWLQIILFLAPPGFIFVN